MRTGHRSGSSWQRMFGLVLLAVCGMLGAGSVPLHAAEPAVKVLFLGDSGHHRPAERAAQLVPVMRERGIEIQNLSADRYA